MAWHTFRVRTLKVVRVTADGLFDFDIYNQDPNLDTGYFSVLRCPGGFGLMLLSKAPIADLHKFIQRQRPLVSRQDCIDI